MELKKGQNVKLLNGKKVTIDERIGEGGQGIVYKVKMDGKTYALKWYLPNYLKSISPSCEVFYRNLQNNVNIGSPSNAFLWQKAIAITGQNSEGFGYIMDLRPKEYEEFTKFIKAKVHFKNTETVIKVAINIVEAFQALHRKGLSYQDLSPGNFFINKETGDVLICDNDNVAPNGTNLGVGGTPGYMAPEVILGTSAPNTNTDLFSLAVILFELFFMSHPLDGANCCKYPCLTQKVEKELYAVNPIFVMDSSGNNPPVRGVHSNLIKLWPTYPKFLQEAFQKAFSVGIKDSNKRINEREWKKILYRLIDNSLCCSHCGELNFVDLSVGNEIKCFCGHKFNISNRLNVNDSEIYVGKDKILSELHLSYGDSKKVIGTCVESKKTPGVFGLRNDSDITWYVEYPGKPMTSYVCGKTVTLIPGTVISISNKKVSVL